MSRSRNWCFTLHNYTDEDEEIFKNIKCRYIIYGREVCPTTQRKHLQGYIQYDNQRTLTAIKKSLGLPKIHLEISNGSSEDNKTYCSKDNDVYERGDCKKQGRRTDIEDIKNLLTEGCRLRDIVPVATSVQSVRMAEIHLKYFERKRDWKPEVMWFWGPTGTGKTREAYEILEDPYTTLDTGNWWEGYDAHPHVIIDDMRGDFMKYHRLLKLLDRYPYIIECKGGSRQFLAEKIIITSAYHPRDIFSTREDIEQLLRRIDCVKEFKKII